MEVVDGQICLVRYSTIYLTVYFEIIFNNFTTYIVKNVVIRGHSKFYNIQITCYCLFLTKNANFKLTQILAHPASAKCAHHVSGEQEVVVVVEEFTANTW